MQPNIRLTLASTGEVIYWPAGSPKGGIVCLHGSEGGLAGWNDRACALFASNGFAAMSHSYTLNARWPVLPDIDNVPLESSQAALSAMRSELAALNCRLGLYGVSRGAERALLLSQVLSADGCEEAPDAIAVHSPPDEIWPAFIVADFITDAPWAGDPHRPAWSWRGSHDRTRPGIALGDGLARYPVFIAQGTEDRTWDAEMAHRLATRMIQAGRAPEMHFFESEDHVFGTAAHNREWELMLDFFERHLSDNAS